MGSIIALLIIIITLLGYIIYLHLKLGKQNVFIETTVKRLSGIDKTRSMEDMVVFLEELQKLSQYSAFFHDKFQEKGTIDFITGNGPAQRIYIHYTKFREDAYSILREGFKFSDSFYKTALQVSKDKLDLTIKHNSRKYFGDYLIVICISNEIVERYSHAIKEAGIKDYSFENLLTETSPEGVVNSDMVFQLAPQYIKGFVNHLTGEIVTNQKFDPGYDSPAFRKNIALLKPTLN